MTPGFKYHVLTICAIFLALTVGLTVGGLTFSPQLVKSYNRTLTGLRATLNEDIGQKTVEAARYKEAFAAAKPAVISGKLSGRSIAVIQSGDYAEAVPAITEALRDAGANVLAVITVQHPLDRPKELLAPELSALHAADARVPLTRTAVLQTLAMCLARPDVNGQATLSSLEKAGLIAVDADFTFATPAQEAVIAAGSRLDGADRASAVDQPLVQALQAQGMTVVMGEPEDAAVSDVPAYRSLQINVATVDDVDSDIGQCSLVACLLGARDDYGVKPSANNLMPPLGTPK